MKAHIAVPRPKALIWGGCNQDAALDSLLARMNIRERRLTEADLPLCVGALCDLPGRFPAGSPAPEGRSWPSALILQGLSDEALDDLLAGLKSENIVIELKAIVTPTNQKWPLHELLNELCREHEAFQKS